MKIPAIAVPTISTPQKPFAATPEAKKSETPPPKLLEKEIKEEPIDEEFPGAMANVTTSKPINLRELLNPPLPPGVKSYTYPNQLVKEVKRESPPSLVLSLKRKSPRVDIPSSSNQPNIDADRSTPKRSRKPVRHDDFVYDQSELTNEADEEWGPPIKQTSSTSQSNGCRCEYVVPELEQKMDRMLEKMHFIETLARSMLGREDAIEKERNVGDSALQKAQIEINQLKRQLIIQRNQKAKIKSENDNNN